MEEFKKRAYSSWLLERIATGDVIRLCLGSSTIGRHPGCVITIPDSTYVSRRHAEITVSADDAEVQIRDLVSDTDYVEPDEEWEKWRNLNGISLLQSSINGVWVNGIRHRSVDAVEQTKLKPNDRIGIGVTDDSDVDPIFPVFLLKYAPLRRVASRGNAQLPKSVIEVLLEPKQEVVGNDDRICVGNSGQNVVKPTTASASTSSTLPDTTDRPILLAGTIIELSDDECDDDSSDRTTNARKAALSNASSTTSNTAVTANISTTGNATPIISSAVNSSKTELIPTTTVVASSSGSSAPTPISNSSSLDSNVHMPKISSVKQEYVRSMSANIQTIFGETDDVILEKVKDINPYVYNDLNGKSMQMLSTGQKPLVNGDSINLTSDDEDASSNNDNQRTTTAIRPSLDIEGKCTSKTRTIQSPNIFEGSLNSSKELEHIDEQPMAAKSASEKEPDRKESVDSVGSATAIEAEDDNYELMFSQVLVNDMKAEMAGDEEDAAVSDGVVYDNPSVEGTDMPPQAVHIKSEPADEVISTSVAPNNEIDSSCWIISDEEDYDEELEHKVSGWTNKLFSQNLSQLSMSQVFEVEDSEEEKDTNDQDGNGDMDNVEDDDDYFDNFYNCQLDDAAKIVDDVVASLRSSGAQPKVEVEEELGSIEMPIEEGSESPIIDEINKNDESSVTVSIPAAEQKEKNDAAEEHTPSSKNDIIACKKPTHDATVRRDNRPSHDSMEPKSKERRKSLLIEVPLVHEQNEVAADKQTENDRSKEAVCIAEHTKAKYNPPPVIDAPQLPKHKGRLRGVSAVAETSASSISSKVASLRAEMRAENYSKELKRKWCEKPKDANRREKEHKRIIKESRKERLKELADKSAAESIKKSVKRTLPHDTECGAKKAKIKITTVNRGAFLAEDVPKERIAYKIPKRKTNDASSDPGSTEAHSKATTAPATANTHTSTATSTSSHSISTAQRDAFAQEISKPDELIMTRHSTGNAHTKTLDPQSKMTTAIAEPRKEEMKARAQRTKNKITFASMQKNFMESRRNQEKLQQIFSAKRSCLTDVAVRDANTQRAKKQVRFNDDPVVHYIERVNGATKKVDKKEVLPRPTLNDRRYNVRSTYTIVDCTNKIISQFLNWSNEWLVKRNAKMDAASNLLLPMPNQFTSIGYYKSIIFPLMKLEFVSMLEREYCRCQAKAFTVSLENVTENKDRLLLITKTRFRNNSEPRCELALLDWGKKRTFAYVSGKYSRPGGSCSTIVFEIIAHESFVDELRSVKELSVRPIVDNVRVEFGAFNAVYQLESTPLFSKILNPIELCKTKPPSKRKIAYKGFDKLNERQQQVLLSTYAKAIEPIPNITLIQGPPGTGKSCVIANLVLQLLYGDEVRCLDQKVLICAQSNAAVDVLAEKLYYISQKMRPDIMFRLIRYGVLERINPRVQPASLQKIVERNQLRKLKAAFKNLHFGNNENIKDYLKNEMKQLEASIADMKLRNLKDTVEEQELYEKQRQLQLMRNIVNGCLRPEDERSIYSSYLTNANVVCATLSSCVKLSQYVNYFDVCIIDEATQCTEPWTILPLKFGINSLILVGDTQQLPATVLSKKAYDYGLGTSLFTRIQRCIETANKSTNDGACTLPSGILFNLQTQYRMHPEICKWPNAYFYKNELINATNTLQYKTPIMPFSILNLQYTQNENCANGQIINELEVKFIAKLVKACDAFIPMNYNTYGVITPYAQQRNALESALRGAGLTNVMVNTIDSYQGIERDVIIISNARTTGIGFLAHHQRLNVALTRPKKCLLLCGNFKNLESAPTWRSLLKSARERNLFHEISVDCFDDMMKNVIDKIKIAAVKA